MEDDTVISAVCFIQSVAAIVIQTGFRRHLACLTVEKMRLENAIVPQSQKPKSHNKKSLEPIGRRAETVLSIECEEASNKDIMNDIPMYTHETLCEKSGQHSKESQQHRFLLDAKNQKGFKSMEIRMYELAAIRIQSVFRGFWVRDCVSVDHYCAKVIQTAYRGFHCRMQYNFDVHRIIVVQSIWRRFNARFAADDRLAATIYLQAAIRGYQMRKLYTKLLSERKPNRIFAELKTSSRDMTAKSKKPFRFSKKELKVAAATLIQATWRMYWSELNFIKTLVDVLIVQSAARGWLARKQLKAEHKKQTQRNVTSRQGKLVFWSSPPRSGKPKAVTISPFNAGGSPSGRDPMVPAVRLPAQWSTQLDAQPAVVTPMNDAPENSEFQSSDNFKLQRSTFDLQPRSRCSGSKNSAFPLADTEEAKTKSLLTTLPSERVSANSSVLQNHALKGRLEGDGSDMASTAVRRQAYARLANVISVQAKLQESLVVNPSSPRFDSVAVEPNAKDLLSMWKDRDKKNSLVLGRKPR